MHSRQKRIDGMKKLQQQNTDYHGLLRRKEDNIRAAELERTNVQKDLEEMTKKLEKQRMRVNNGLFKRILRALQRKTKRFGLQPAKAGLERREMA